MRALYRHPGLLPPRTEHELRYALNFARLTSFQPGAAAKGGRSGRADVEVAGGPVLSFRGQLLEHLPQVLNGGASPAHKLKEAAQLMDRLAPALKDTRRRVLEHHAEDFSPKELDEEVGIKTLVSVAGGGGGAGYVYIGAYEVLDAAELVPGYILGSSMGALIGLFRARKKIHDLPGDIALAKSLQWDQVFRFVSVRAKYGLPGLMRLFLHAGIGKRFLKADGSRFRLPDLEIPYEAVVAGVWRGALKGSPEEYARIHHLVADSKPSGLALGRRVAAQLVRMVAFFNPMIVKEIPVGADELTGAFDCVDAAGFSAAVPGILHYDIAREDPHMAAILAELFRREEIACLIDGGVANNVPVRTAWHQVHAGKIGTRNCYFLGFDCFHPQWSLGHIPLQGISRVIQLQVALNRPYAHRIVQFNPTLSPMNLLPKPAQIDQAVQWGRRQMAAEIPILHKFFEPVKWYD